MTQNDGVLVLIPAYNEEETVATVVRKVLEAGHAVVVVDDGSTDATAERAREAGAPVLQLPFNLGVGGALRCGFRWAVANGFETVVQVDADGQHDPDQVEALVAASREASAHLLVGSRFGAEDGYQATRVRRIPMWLLSRVASRAAGREITDSSSGFRVIREPLLSEFARAYPVHYLGDTFEVLVQAGRSGYTVAEVPVRMSERAGGVRSAGTGASVRFLVRALVALLIGSSRGYRPYASPRSAKGMPVG